METPIPLRDKIEVADVFRSHGNAYQQHQPLSSQQKKVMNHIAMCRTAHLGGHLERCNRCGHEHPFYNSCRDRHCPKCQSLRQAIWIEKRKQRVLPTHYFHVVFTLPYELRALTQLNKELIYKILFDSASKTLLELGNDPKYLGAQLGITAVLHTWSRDLQFHPHLHCIVTGGGLDNGKAKWIPIKRQRYLFPIKVISTLFRGKCLDAIVKAYRANKLDLFGRCSELTNPSIFDQWKDSLYRKDWHVYAKRPFGGPQQVINYLGRYIHRVAISNQRLLSSDEKGVCFITKKQKRITLSHETFIHRFLLHILPPGFTKIRHYGLMGASNVNTKLVISRRLLMAEHPIIPISISILIITTLVVFGIAKPRLKNDWQTLMLQLSGINVKQCPKCGKGTMEYHPLPRSYKQKPTIFDTS